LNYNDASDYIHSPFVALRDTIDNGFSGGWGLHVMTHQIIFTALLLHLEIQLTTVFPGAGVFISSLVRNIGWIATTILNQEKVMKR